MRRRVLPLVLALAGALCTIVVDREGPAAAAPSQPGFTDGIVVSGLSAPTSVVASPDGRIFVAEKFGAIRVVKNGVLLPQPFRTLTVDSTGERGLIGIALAPGFPADPRVFVHYTVPTPAHNRVSVLMANGDVASPGETVLLDLPNLSGATNHNGGGLQATVDGKLFVTVGENANPALSQSLTTPFGKVLRINQNGTVPPDNPFVDGSGPIDDRIFALGLRNPYSLGVQPGTGLVFVNDVGSGGSAAREEINHLVAGGNYGWPVVEGIAGNPSFIDPLHAYDHSVGCSITGGVFYNPPTAQFPSSYGGRYFFSDFCGGWIRAFDPSSGSVVEVARDTGSPTGMALAPDGSIAYVDFGAGTGSLRRLGFAGPTPRWLLRNTLTSGVAQIDFGYGEVGDRPLACDWDGDGDDTPAVFRSGAWFIRQANTAGPANVVVGYGDAGDHPVCGDWDGDGDDTVGIRRGGAFYLRNSNTTGVADIIVGYGDTGDAAVVGDWDGDGDDTVGIRRGGAFYLRNSNTTGVADIFVGYGDTGDAGVVGDWDGDGDDTVGIWRPGAFYLRNSNTTGVADVFVSYGSPTDRPITGNWDGASGASVGVVRLP